MRPILIVGLLLCTVTAPNQAAAQGVRALPYSTQLKTDPAVGNVQGIQRYGRPLKTDPDQGEGFSYHVYPVAHGSVIAGSAAEPVLPSVRRPGHLQIGAERPSGSLLREALSGTVVGTEIDRLERELNTVHAQRHREADPMRRARLLDEESAIEARLREAKGRGFEFLERVGPEATGPETAGPEAAAPPGPAERSAPDRFVEDAPGYPVPYPPPFDWTDGIRNRPMGRRIVPPVETRPQFEAPAFARSVAGVELIDIYHQPLIQIRMRVIEVARTDGLAVSSVLEYVSRNNKERSLTSGEPLNSAGGEGFQNLRSLTRFAIPDLVSGADSGTGMLVNLTGEHINWIASLLATEFNADVITAPEVVTLNGQNVEFVAGDKLPFQLGQNVIQGTNNNIQQVFYKHVGTLVSVTPRIVNWGFHGEGEGAAPIVASDILDWNALIRELRKSSIPLPVGTANLQGSLAPYAKDGVPVPFALKSDLLKALNEYAKRDLSRVLGLVRLEIVDESACRRCRSWKPEDCTIDLAVVVRLSEGATTRLDPEDPDLQNVNVESNVRALANVIQVASGKGVVMAGLIGEREIDTQAKVPVLGDVPIVGALFRSRATSRVKTEVLIFLEARVLDPHPDIARVESAGNFRLGQPYVEGALLDNPLEFGLYRAGIGAYLPPHSHSEQIFWERFGRRIRKMSTHVDDVLK